MCRKMIFHPALLMIALIVPTMAFAAGTPKKIEPIKVNKPNQAKAAPIKPESAKTDPVKTEQTKTDSVEIDQAKIDQAKIDPVKIDQSKVKWSIETGMGYDSNAFNAPNKTYIDYAAIPTGSNPTVVPIAKSGFFIPYKARVEAEKRHDKNGNLLASASISGRFYSGSLSKADELNFAASGGATFDLHENKNPKRMVYAGAIYEQHQQMYVDNDSGASKTTTGGSDISGRYNYSSIGLEGEYKHEMGRIDYAIKGKYLTNDYSDPIVVSQLDHNYLSIGGDVDYLVREDTKLNFSIARSTRAYSDRHARRADGVYSSTNNPLLKYTYNDIGVTLRNRASSDWLFYLDYDYSQRMDGFVNYNDYKSHRYGGRLMYEHGALKGRVSLHQWKRDYPHAFAYDVAGQPAKTYNGSDLRAKAEFAQTKALSFWAEAVLDVQDSSDLRYAYDRKQLIAGVKWEQ